MSADGAVTLDWGDGSYTFKLTLEQLRALQISVNKPRIAAGANPVGPRRLLAALISGDEWADDIKETIRLGLMGAGMSSLDALVLVRLHVELRPLSENIAVARKILVAAIAGDPDDPVGKVKAPTTKMTETIASSFPPSMEPGPS